MRFDTGTRAGGGVFGHGFELGDAVGECFGGDVCGGMEG